MIFIYCWQMFSLFLLLLLSSYFMCESYRLSLTFLFHPFIVDNYSLCVFVCLVLIIVCPFIFPLFYLYLRVSLVWFVEFTLCTCIIILAVVVGVTKWVNLHNPKVFMSYLPFIRMMIIHLYVCVCAHQTNHAI